MSKVGFVGLGIMGSPMAGHLIKGGHEVYLYSIPSVPQALVDAEGSTEARPVKSGSADDAAYMLSNAETVVPGYGLAVARAQHAVNELAEKVSATRAIGCTSSKD